MHKIKSILDVDLANKRIFLRVDFNVPFDEVGHISDMTRIAAAIPTIEHLLKQNARLVLVSHLGRPKGKKDLRYSLKPVAAVLSNLIKRPVLFLSDCIGPLVEANVQSMAPGSIILLENLRFYPGEETNDPAFAQKLAQPYEAYVNDAFGTAHRAHASTVGVPQCLPIRVAGFLMQKELTYLGEKTKQPDRPFTVILGGAKVSDKIKVIDALLGKANSMLIGGAMAYTFLKAQGIEIGSSLVEPECLDIAKAALQKAQQCGVRLLLPIDHVVADKIDLATLTVETLKTVEGLIELGWSGVDVGPKTIELFSKEIKKSKTVLWNGPMGIFEIKACSTGTFALAKSIAETKCTSIIGGGDSIKAIKKSGYAEQVSFISTGGGASLEFLEGIQLPGVSALEIIEAKAK